MSVDIIDKSTQKSNSETRIRETDKFSRLLGEGNRLVRCFPSKDLWLQSKNPKARPGRFVHRIEHRRQNIYVTLNPLMPNAREATDRNVEHRQWLFVDVDATRTWKHPKFGNKIPASDAEKAEALKVAESICATMELLCGWRCSIFTDSGNGFALFYKIDLPNDGKSKFLLKRVLKALAREFDTEGAKVDTCVFNAGRIVRVPGSLNLKNVETADRPFRFCRLLESRDDVPALTAEQLEEVAESPEPPREPPAGRTEFGQSLEADLADWGVVVESTKRVTLGDDVHPLEGGTFYQLRCCPACNVTGDHRAGVIEFDSGRRRFKCHGNRHPEDYTYLDFEHDCNPLFSPSAEDDFDDDVAPARASGDGESGEITPPSGLCQMIVDHIRANARREQREFFTAAAIATVATLAANRFRDEYGSRTNLYALMIALSGEGKDVPLKSPASLLGLAGRDSCRIGPTSLASGSALLAALEKCPELVCSIDEFGKFLASAKAGRDPNRADVKTKMLELFSSAGQIIYSAYADIKKNRIVRNPCFNLLGAATPSSLVEAISQDAIRDGFLPRVMIFKSQDDPVKLPGKQVEPSESLIERLCEFGRRVDDFDEAGERICVINRTPTAETIFDHCDTRCDRLRKQVGEPLDLLYSRVVEIASRLAIVAAVSHSASEPVIDEEAALWATETALLLAQRSVAHCRDYVAESPFDARQKEMLRFIRKKGGYVTQSELTRRFQSLRRRDREELMDNLQVTGQIGVVTTTTKGRAKVIVYLRPEWTSEKLAAEAGFDISEPA